jgi:hypothetical protein
MNHISTSIPNLPWATHAVRGFKTENECYKHASIHSPGIKYGVRQIAKKTGNGIIRKNIKIYSDIFFLIKPIPDPIQCEYGPDAVYFQIRYRNPPAAITNF